MGEGRRLTGAHEHQLPYALPYAYAFRATIQTMDFISWLRQLPRAEVEEDLRRLEAERTRLDAEIDARRTALALARELPPLPEQQELVPAGKREPVEAGAPAPPSEAIIRTMAEDPARVWSFGDLMDALVDNGWARDTLSERKRIQVAAMRLANKGAIARPEPGRYQLVPQVSLAPNFPFNLPPIRKSGDTP